MYTFCVVDDETLIRDGLKCIMDWEEIGFTFAGEASNGEDALALILEKQPDLVVMDIRMPKMAGLDVVRLSKEKDFKGHFIILSGYSDFKYAQEAIRFGVESYLTKPVDDDELTEAVLKIKQALDNEKQTSGAMVHLKKKAREVILHELTVGISDAPLSDSDIEDMELDADKYQIVIYENFSRMLGSTYYNFAELLKISNRDDHTFNYFTEDQKDVILLKGTYAMNRFNDFLAHYNDSNPPQKGSPMDTLFIAYGRSVDSLSDIHLSYEDAKRLIARRFFCIQGQHTLGYEELPDINALPYELEQTKLTEYTDYLVGYLQTSNRKKAAETLEQLEKYLYNVSADITHVKLFLTDLYLQIKEKITLLYSTVDIPFATNSSVIDFIDKRFYMYEIIQFLSEQFVMIMNATGNPSSSTVLDDILYYIEHNYQSNIKLETIAPLFGYNSAYLGKIFNRNVGESFNSYIDHMRIERSKQLLLEDRLKVYEIAEKVGYRNVDYFHKKFRKYVGESPAEFRKKNGGSDDEE